jgi:hypothetical protein
LGLPITRPTSVTTTGLLGEAAKALSAVGASS